MTVSPDPSGITRMLADVTAALGSLQAPAADTPPAEHVPIEGAGAALDGAIVATAAMPGRVTSLVFRPTVMRMDSATLAEETMTAVNAALADLQARAAGAGRPSFEALSGQLREIQDSASRQFSAFTEALADAQQRIAERGGR
ncbi:YbaB/EbfC family DNA-binding protein [Actinoplanes teichomyceticus]|uniref:YbaB/EbfC DNA-binding family protein n=1 Tax=Actinoplanes teichomyceticus TaxID=1867 RepID=A0A561WKV0_ACTTI|nr:YbaB/EbfC family DNA-binding protein [Actinoplanes teichomyceticus]TWG24484.1 hypothetical protein FHX34_1021040 [Actinoplanes teichomyceticus]GIF12665.1 hypothetical protein Ate01nite_26970 [Actinoplanes teichomyceticus]